MWIKSVFSYGGHLFGSEEKTVSRVTNLYPPMIPSKTLMVGQLLGDF